ncbi:MAG TPA: tetratricopeptide repeat protein [Candidatus Saccharimonadales bacterium]|nr:tetratricopeptide repeat protein [Candidatus Saccharimonadales bacterium]
MQELFEKAQKLRNNGQIKEAISLYKEVRSSVLKTDRHLASECLHMIGVSYYQSENFDEAGKNLTSSLKEFEEQSDPQFSGFVLRDLGMVARGENKFHEAKEFLNRSIEKLQGNNGHEGMTRVKLGRVLAEEGNFDGAYEEINRGIILLENSSETFFLSSAYLDRAKVDTLKSLHVLDSFSKKDEFKERRKEIKKILGN